MRLAVFGDIHANLQALEAVLGDAREWMACDRFLCLGDLVGYGANPGECVERVRALGCPVLKGNHDEQAAIDDSLEGFSPLAETSLTWTRHRLLPEQRDWLGSLPLTYSSEHCEAVHASLDQPHRWGYLFNPAEAAVSLRLQTRPLCFFGHTHMPRIYRQRVADRVMERAGRWIGLGAEVQVVPDERLQLESGFRYHVNTGSVGQPRDGDVRASYAVFDPELRTVMLRRVAYDVQTAQASILAAGLPKRLADRLELGK